MFGYSIVYLTLLFGLLFFEHTLKVMS
jgi:heme O synthase-like polyprenyltransferase